MPAPAVEFSHVSKSYSIYSAPRDRLKELATFQRRKFHTDFWALRDVSFEIQRGETFCVVGENGSGKSTLLQICAGILRPSSGSAIAHGRVAALLELGSGFNPEFSGRDNVYLNGTILGFSKKEMDQRWPDIEAFAEIGEFIDQPVKTYSSGMAVRLAFAVAIHVDPEILLVDEALAVGDVYFRQRCMRKVHELRARGTTLLLVSHATGDIKALGDRAMWLEKGAIQAIGATDQVVHQYLAAMSAKDRAYQAREIPADAERSRPAEVVEGIPNIDHRFGDGKAEVLGIAVMNPEGHRLGMLTPSSTIVVRISVRAKANLDKPIIGFIFRNHLGVDFAGTNTARERVELPPLFIGDVCTVDFYVDLPALYAGSFSFSPAIANGTLEHYSMCDWIDNAQVLQMERSEDPIYGQFHFPCEVRVNAKVGAGSTRAVTEFTGERVIPGQVEDDLWAEHIARYAFAARYAVGKRVLDLGCGTGYGAAELAAVAREVTGVDNSFDAVAYATEHYPQARFFPLSAASLPFPDGSFDLITAFELIEHLSDWRGMLAEARRVLDPSGLLIVSTPNKLYYAEARGAAGANPFHAHEFEFGEFQDALRGVFPHVRVWLQDRVEGFAFYCADSGSGRAEAPAAGKLLQAEKPAPQTANFFVGLCSASPLPEGRTFLYVPGVGNLLRERERHIGLLEKELTQVREWLAETTAARDQLLSKHAALEKHLDEQNRWGRELESLLRAAQARIVELQEQFQAEQARAAEVIAGLNEENRRKTEWALETERRLSGEIEQRLAQLADAVRALERSEATLLERTRWAQDLDAQLAALAQQMGMVRQSRWIKLGRRLGLGPQLGSE